MTLITILFLALTALNVVMIVITVAALIAISRQQPSLDASSPCDGAPTVATPDDSRLSDYAPTQREPSRSRPSLRLIGHGATDNPSTGQTWPRL